ncbi:hypothetical protein SAMN05216583_102237, partial [Selenomonas sp. KH1T6]
MARGEEVYLCVFENKFFTAGRIYAKNGEGFQKVGFQPNSHLLSG